MAANQNTSLLKVNQLSKDLNMKSKDLNELLAGKGITLKTQQTLKPEEFNLIFETITMGHQIENIEDYLDGITYIPSKKKAAEAKPKEEPLAQEPAKVSAKAEEKPAVQESKATKEPEKAQAKVESVSSTEKTEKKEKEVKAQSPAKAEKEKKAEMPSVKAEPVKQQERKADNTERPAQKSQMPQGAARQGNYSDGAQKPQTQGQYGQKPQGQYGQRPQGQNQYGQRPQGQQPQGQNKGDRFQNPFGAGQRQQGGQRPQGQNQGGFRQGGNNDRFGGGQFKDKDERSQNAPRERFKPQLIVRGQTEKGEVASKQKGATRVVDMRAGSVDLSKYDERLDNFVPDSIGDIRGGSQKVKKQPVQNKNMQQGGKNNKFNKGNKKSTQPVTKAPTSVTLPAEIVVSDLASRLKVTSGEVVKRLMMLGMMVTVNQTVDYDTAAIVAEEMGISATQEVVVTIEERLFDEVEDNEDTLVERAPVVCVMGHVDHGKTSILDAIRNTHVTRGEAGGITQHIGAYRVKVQGHDITFLDTPGHEAFTAMRARGAQATDIAILVVAADDGIMPQTVEAINHAKAAGIDIVVAINKMDKPTANPDAIKQELTKYDLVPEEWGGDVICVPVSALTGFGIEDLLENVLLVAEVKELKANPNRRAKGIVIEAKLDKGRGPVATVLVQNGTLHNGDIVIAGTAVGRVRAMTDDKGRNVKEAKPSVPVEIIGLAEVPNSGDEFNAVEDERMARALADQRREKAKEEVFKANARANLNDLFAQISEGVKELNIIVKADVGGSVEAVKQSLEKISNEEVKVRVIHGAAGAIREGDVMLAAASNAIIVGFNVRPDKAAIDSAERQNVEIRTYRVIYDCINEITDAMKGMLAPKFRENLLGHAEVRQTIHVPNVGTIAGSYIQDGKVTRASMIRVVRDGVVIFEDKISSLRRFKDDVKEVATGYECGIGLDRFNDIKIGDVLEAYIMEEIER